jgi:hypothetical protein
MPSPPFCELSNWKIGSIVKQTQKIQKQFLEKIKCSYEF